MNSYSKNEPVMACVVESTAHDQMSTGQLKDVDVSWLHPNPDQPRKTFCPQALQELSDSIAANGLQQPITCTDDGMIIAGERRWRALRLARVDRAPAIVISGIDNDEIFRLSMIENIVRQDMTPVEEAKGFARMLEQHLDAGLSRADAFKLISAQTGLTKIYISDRVKLLRLPDEALAKLESGELNRSQCWYAMNMPSEGKMHLFLKLCEQGRCNTTDEMVAVNQAILSGKYQKTVQDTLLTVDTDPEILRWTKQLQYCATLLTELFNAYQGEGSGSEGLASRMGPTAVGRADQLLWSIKDVSKRLGKDVQATKASLFVASTD